MDFIKLKIEPGIVRETTRYTASGRWYDCDKIRFRAGFPEKIGGWQKLTTAIFDGSCRALHRWGTLNGSIYMGVGTNTRLYVEDGSMLNELTPWTTEDTGLSGPFTTVDTTSDIEVTKPTHGRSVGDRIEIEGSDAVNGILAVEINGTRTIASTSDINTYTFTSGGTATSSGGSGGGTPVTIRYILQDGIDQQISGTGWGSDAWNDGAWGEPGTLFTSTGGNIRTWSLDNFGEDLIACVYDGDIYYWDVSISNSLTVRFAPLSSVAGASGTPTVARLAMVSSKDRRSILFGADTLDNPGVQDPLHIRWSDTEDVADFTPSTVSTAGSLTIGSGIHIVAALQTRQEILVWTDTDLHSMQYVGGTFIYGINQIAKGTSIIGRNAATVYLGVSYWMGESGFYVYDGQAREMPCSVEDYVFSDFAYNQSEKVYASINSAESEIIWFYPSSSSSDVDRYVIYNVKLKIWYIGTMDRTAWINAFDTLDNPIAASCDGYIYTQEFGNLDGSTSPESQIIAHVESGELELQDGYSYAFVDRLIPDITFRSSVSASPSVTVTLTAYDNPGLATTDSAAGGVARSVSAPVEVYTDNVWLRIRGRSLVYRVEDTANAAEADTSWRLGTSRISVRPDGRK